MQGRTYSVGKEHVIEQVYKVEWAAAKFNNAHSCATQCSVFCIPSPGLPSVLQRWF